MELSLEKILEAEKHVKNSNFVIKTPMWKNCGKRFARACPVFKGPTVHLKLENCQISGSFKIRGVVNQVAVKKKMDLLSKSLPVTMSAGNYGKAFALILQNEGFPGHVVMPSSAPADRVELITSLGCSVEQVPVKDLQVTVDQHVKEDGMTFYHSYDDLDLMAGHGSLGLEILDDCEPDIVMICCGGGGLLAGTAAAIKLTLSKKGSSKHCLIYGVEPEGAPTMFESYKQNRAVGIPSVSSIATGLSPPYAGPICYAECCKYVDDILLVSDSELAAAVTMLHSAGIVAEPAGAAAFAAMAMGKVPVDVGAKEICLVITGSNVEPKQIVELHRGQNTMI